MKKPRFLLSWLAITLLIALSISGCFPIIKATFETKISLQEKWSFYGKLIVPPQSASLLSQYLAENFANNQQLKQAGVQVSVKPSSPDNNGNVPIELSMDGKGYDTFRMAFGSGSLTVDETGGSRILNFSLSTGLTAQATEFTLSGGKILDHNGTLVDGTTVKWVNYPGTMTAKMQEPTWADYLPWIIFGCGTVVVVFGAIALVIVLTLARKKPAQQRAYAQPAQAQPFQQPPVSNTTSSVSSYPPPMPQVYVPPASPIQPSLVSVQPQTKPCVQCQTSIPAHSTFCPHCGAKQN